MIFCEKSVPAPSCLEEEKVKASGDYKCGDVLKRLQTDFGNKCYICEMKEPPGINVEHFMPHEGDTEWKFAWTNLFFACPHCNNIKRAGYKNLLNCTLRGDEVETNLKYTLNPFPFEMPIVEALKSGDARVKETQALLTEVYNGRTESKKLEAANIRDAMLREIKEFQQLLIDHFVDKLDRDYVLPKIERHLRWDSGFAAFKRWIIRDNPTMMAELGHLLER